MALSLLCMLLEQMLVLFLNACLSSTELTYQYTYTHSLTYDPLKNIRLRFSHGSNKYWRSMYFNTDIKMNADIWDNNYCSINLLSILFETIEEY